MVNRRLGGYSIVKEGVEAILSNHNLSEPVHIADIGCGGGDTLREIADWAKERGVNLKLSGIDANEHAVKFSEDCSKNYPQINYRQVNIFSEEFKSLNCDIIMFNLFAHHFEEAEIIRFLKICKDKKAVVLVNDLQRSALAYGLFGLSSALVNFSRISRHDGMLSIRKGFSRKDWHELLHRAGFENYTVKWRWAFRFQVIAW